MTTATIPDPAQLDTRVREILRTINPTEPGGDWSTFDVANVLDPAAHTPRSLFDTGGPYASDAWCTAIAESIARIHPSARYVGGVSRHLYSISIERT